MKVIAVLLFAVSVLSLSNCNSEKVVTEHSEGHDSSGEETSLQENSFNKDQVFDQERNGMRLVLQYDTVQMAFTGKVTNVTGKTIKAVRVEVHLSNDVELGPTVPVDLLPYADVVVRLDAKGQVFDRWIAHPERD